MKKLFSYTLILTLLMTIGCSIDESNEILQPEDTSLSLIEILSSNALLTAKRPQPPVWVDCIPFTGLVVPATFKPGKGNFDELYAGADFSGNPLISDYKPGDQDYNGGRWHMNVLRTGVDTVKYINACSEEDLDMNDFMPALDMEGNEMYFECPLKKSKS